VKGAVLALGPRELLVLHAALATGVRPQSPLASPKAATSPLSLLPGPVPPCGAPAPLSPRTADPVPAAAAAETEGEAVAFEPLPF